MHTARLRLGKIRVDGIYRNVADEKGRTQHVYVWEEEWAVVSRDDVDGVSPILIHVLPSAEISNNVQIYELPDDYIITVWRRNEHGVNS